MKAVLAFGVLLSTTFGQDLSQLRSPLRGWVNDAPKWRAEGPVRQAAEGRVRSVAIDEGALELFRSSEEERVALVSFENSGAFATRVHFEDFRVPNGGKVFVYGLDQVGQVTRIVGPYTASGPTQGGEFWSRAIPGSRVVVEVQSNKEFGTLPFTIREISEVDGIEEGEERLELQASVERRVSVFRGMAIEHSVVDGIAIWEGDILLGRVEELERFTGNPKQLERSAVSVSSLWTGGTVPYTISATLPNQQRITDAIAHWNTNLSGYLRLVPRTTESAYVTFVQAAASTCSSYIGRTGVAGQPINIGDYCSTGNVIHEIGHAVGLYHEHTRSDRGSWVTINTANIDPNASYNFNMVSGVLQGTYDYGSIMHYGAYAFSINGQPTITQLQAGPTIGQRSGLSAGDISGAQLMYPSSGGTTAPPPPPTGTVISAAFQSNPSGRTLTVDGVNVLAPTTTTWISGTSHTVSAPNQASGGTSYIFSSWSDGGAQSHTTMAGTSSTSLTATYMKKHKLTLSVQGSGSADASPATSDGYYNEGSSVQISAQGKGNKCFTGWSGILNVSSPTVLLTMTQPYTVTAGFANGSVSAGPSVSLSAAAQQAQASVSATSVCVWTASTSSSWISLITTSGRGSGVIQFYAAQNTTGVNRSATILVNGKAITISQSR